jgi:putative phosphoribosyl transferase
MARQASLRRLDEWPRSPRATWARTFTGKAAVVDAGAIELPGELTVPVGVHGVVAFAHGSGSSRLSPRNQEVARALHDAHLATLLFDLLTPEESVLRDNVFDVDLLGRRLLAATRWLRAQPEVARLPIGYFGASTGAAAAFWAAAESRSGVTAVVSRGGRPDLARAHLPRVPAPSLLIVGGEDPQVLALNRWACAQLRCERELVVVPGATHLFEEPGALEQVAQLAAGWFAEHLV